MAEDQRAGSIFQTAIRSLQFMVKNVKKLLSGFFPFYYLQKGKEHIYLQRL